VPPKKKKRENLDVTRPCSYLEGGSFSGLSPENQEPTEGNEGENEGQSDRSHIIEII
jgi:hypothetical protein